MASESRRRSMYRLLGLCVYLFSMNPAAALERAFDAGGVHATLWLPDPLPAAQLPIILFSHGFHGCATQSRFLMEALANAGYIVAAPNHKDAMCGGGARKAAAPQRPFCSADQWSDATYADRAGDIHALIAALKADAPLNARIDWGKLGLAGFSLGGYTMLGMAGAWESWTLPEVKAVLALSPYSRPFEVHKTFSDLHAPVMYQGGTRDMAVTPAIKKPGGYYDLSPSPKYYIEFQGAGHLAWTGRGKKNQPLMVAYAVGFFDYYVKGDASREAFMQSAPKAAEIRYDTSRPLSQTGVLGWLRERLAGR